MAAIWASPLPALKEACTTPAGMNAQVAGAEEAFLPVDPLLDLAGDDEDTSSWSGCLWKLWPLPGEG